jgi:hypothetical protein
VKAITTIGGGTTSLVNSVSRNSKRNKDVRCSSSPTELLELNRILNSRGGAETYSAIMRLVDTQLHRS